MTRAKSSQTPSSLRGIRRDRDCQSCRQRGVKCDLNRPRCLPCVQSGLACGGYPQRVVWTGSPRLPAKRQAKARVSNEQQAPILRRPAPSRAERPGQRGNKNEDNVSDRDWLLEKLSAVCRNFELPPRALPASPEDRETQHQWTIANSPLLLSRVEGFLRAHMTSDATVAAFPFEPSDAGLGLDSSKEPTSGTRRGDEENDDDPQLHQLAALNSLTEAVKTADPVALVGMLAFAFFDVTSDSNFGHWQRHLRGARSLLDYHCQGRPQLDGLLGTIGGLPEMMAYFCWWDTNGAIVRCLSSEPGGARNAYDLVFADWHREAMSKELFDSVGCSAETFQLLVDLVKSRDDGDFISEMESGSSSGRRRARREQIHGLRDRALSHLFELALNKSPQGRYRDAWRCAAAIAVLTWPPHAQSSSSKDNEDTQPESPWRGTVQRAVARICDIIRDSSYTCRFYAHVATPVYLAAMNTESPRERDIMARYWTNCQAGRFPRYSGVLTQCEDLWRSKGLMPDIGP